MTLTLIAIRHAEPLTEGYAEDALRPLSERGKRIQRQVTLQLRERSITPAKIYTSPLLRAVQTGEIVAEEFGLETEQIDSLGNAFNGDELIDLLKSQPLGTTIVFVGHAPTLAQFVNAVSESFLLQEGLHKSSVACVSFSGDIGYGMGDFKWVIHP